MITYSLYTNKGDRDNNEDAVGMKEKDGNYCFVLCDGLGGHGKGEVASQTAVDEVKQYFQETEEYDSCLGNSILQAQNRILSRQKEDRELYDMKTTIVVLIVIGNSVQWGHVGDSRLYHFRKHKLIDRTLDHSVPQLLVRTKEIKEKDIRNHPDRNRLLRVMGMPWEKEMYEISNSYESKGKEAFLLCTDGFWELINEKDMTRCLKKSETVEEWIESMSKIVIENGKGKEMDNFSAIGVFIDGN